MLKVLLKLVIIFHNIVSIKKWRKSKYNILIYEKDTKRVKILREILSQKLNGNYQILFASKKVNFLALSGKADVIYAYGLSRYADTSRLKLLFIGMVGDGFSEHSEDFKIVHTPNFASSYVADYIVASVFAFERRLLQNAFLKINQKWCQKFYVEQPFKQLNELKIGIIGLGKVGSETANAFTRFGCKVFVFDKDPDKMIGFSNSLSEHTWQDMLSFVDYFIIAVDDQNNINLIDDKLISRMNQNLCMVNVSRASVVDEKSLIKSLKEKRIRGAILDVFNHEPLKRNSIYWKLKNVVATPHIAGNIDLVFPQIAGYFVNEIKNTINV